MPTVPSYPKFFLATMVCLSFLYFLYLPILQQPSILQRPIDVKGWEGNKSRDTSLYVRPLQRTTLMIGREVCPPPPLNLLIAVCSSVQNFSMRSAIRDTWSKDLPAQTSVMFFVGRNENVTLQEYLEDENQFYGDIVQEDFLDSYNNLTIKSVMMLKFIRHQCAHAQYIVKTDDDIYFDVRKLDAIMQAPRFKQKSYGLMGCLIKHSKPIRSASRKWYTPEYMFNENVYPDYLAGVAYLMSSQVLQTLYDVALRIPLLHHEDVFITGICAKAAGIKPRRLPGIDNGAVDFDVCHSSYIVVHRFDAAKLRRLWSPVISHKCNLTSLASSSLFHRLITLIR